MNIHMRFNSNNKKILIQMGMKNFRRTAVKAMAKLMINFKVEIELKLKVK